MRRGGHGPAASRARPGRTRPAPRDAAHATPAARSGRPAFPWGEGVVVLACVALALWVHRRALGGFFSLDDLVILEEIRGLRENAPGFWRFIPRYVYLENVVPLFGSNPIPYHVVSALLHGANVVLLYAFVRGRSGSVVAAAVAAGLFGTSRLHFSALGAATTIGEPLALGLTLAAVLVHDRGGRARIAAPLLFLGALLSKESVALLPAALLVPGAGGGSYRERFRRAAPLLALGALFAVALAASGIGATRLGGEAYARAFGANLIMNLMTYTKWAADPRDPFVGQVSAIDPGVWPLGAAVTLGLATLVIVARRAPLPPVFGVSWWLLGLLPVLPLLHHSYLYYLYVPFAGLAMVMGGTAGLVVPMAVRAWRSPRLVSGLAALVVLAHAVIADRLLTVRYAARMPGTGVPLDPDLRKSEMARQAARGVGTALAGRRARVAFLMPASLERVYSTATGERLAQRTSVEGSYGMLAGALDEGRGLRVLLPNVDSVTFLSAWTPGHADFELFSQSPEGTVFSLGRGADGYAAAGAAMTRNGETAAARELLAASLSEFPDHAPLRFQYARTFYVSGDSLAMRRELEELLRRTPDHPLAAHVRASFPGVGRGK